MEVKDLYLATTMSDLNKLTAKNLQSMPSSIKQIINLMQVLEKQARENELDGDQEQAYILYMRYFDVYKLAPKCKDYKDKSYMESMIGKQKFKDVLERVTRLNDALRERYDYLQAKRLSDTLEAVNTEKMKKDSQKSDKTTVTTTKRNEPGIPQTWLSAIDLASYLKKSSSDLLILDVRPEEEFQSVSIKNCSIINVPEEKIIPGSTVADIKKFLDSESAYLFSRRDKMKIICLLDWEATPDLSNHLPQCFTMSQHLHAICIVKDAIFKWDAECKVEKEPLILYGGMKEFLLRYPTYTTNPTFKKEKKSDDSSSTSVKELIIYPDLEKQEAEKKRLAEEKKRLAEEKERQIVKEREEVERLRKEELKRVNQKVKELQVRDKGESELESRFACIKMPKSTKSEAPSTPPVNRSDKPPLSPPRKLSPLPPSLKRDPSPNPTPRTVKISGQPPQPDRRDKPSLNHTDNQPKVTKPEDSVTNPVITNISEENAAESSVANDEPSKSTMPPPVVSGRPPKPDYQRPNEAPARLSVSQNSFTNDRPSFAAKGGAKPSPAALTAGSQPPGSQGNTGGVHTADGLPPHIEKVHDSKTNRYFYIDHKTKQTSWEPPSELSHGPSMKSPPDYNSHVTTQKLKDSKSSSGSGSQLKRFGSQPNLANLNDSGMSRYSSDNEKVAQPQVDRGVKPSQNRKPIQQLDANRLRRLEPSYGSVPHGLTGLRNLGNTCYMNSVLQSLSNTRVLTHYFREGDYRNSLNRNNPLGHGGEVADEFAILVSVLWAGSYKDVSPRDFRNMVARNAQMFSDSHQQDSQEFLLFLLDGLHEDLNQVVQRPRTAFKDDETLNDEKRAELAWSWHLKLNQSIVVNLFQGQFKSTVRCLTCDTQSITFDAFMYLSLPIPSPTKCTLKECLELFLSEERMTGTSQWFCPKCKENRDAVKSIAIWKLPPYLLIHLKRFSCDGAYRQKLDTYVDFPVGKLDLNLYVNSRQESQPYNLYAVSNHYGNMEGGHYTCYAKNMHSHSWHKFDDDLVNPMRSDDVKTYAAYILFYESMSMKASVHVDTV